MSDTVSVTIDVDRAVAAALENPPTRAAIGRLVSSALGPNADAAGLAEAFAAARATTKVLGADVGRRPGDGALASDFRAFRGGRALGGLDPKALIREGLG